MKVAILTLGCRVNQSESQEIESTLRGRGAHIVSLSDNPDFCIINTCTVTSKSDYNSRQLIRRAARTGAKIFVTGCYSQLHQIDVRDMPGVTALFDIRNKVDIANEILPGIGDFNFSNFSRSRPYLKVQDGCNFQCSYCSVPLARGKSRSTPLSTVIERAKNIESAGYKEIVLTGIHLGSYGYDLHEAINIKTLLKELLKSTKAVRFRLSSIEVNEIDDEFIELVLDDRICKHLHIPLQSGSDHVLSLMRRAYSARRYLDIVRRIASKVDSISIGTDVIVGFPGESESDFQLTHEIAHKLPFAYFHVFPFSSRPGSRASIMPKKNDSNVIVQRVAVLQELCSQKKLNFIESQLYNSHRVIIEDRLHDGMHIGTSDNYLKIKVRCDYLTCGSMVTVIPCGVDNGLLVANYEPPYCV